MAAKPAVSILFDFGGTLDADGIRWSIRFYDAFRKAGGQLPFERFEPVLQESDQRLARVPLISRADFQETIATQSVVLARLLADLDERVDPGALTQPVHDRAVAIVKRNRPVLRRLARHHRLGVVSNFTGNLAHCLRDLKLLKFFAVVVDSGLVGIEKPDPRIFQRALAELGADPGSTWMVGDNPDADLVPAAALGLSTCWLTPADETRVLPPGVPTVRIASLTELPAVLVPFQLAPHKG